MTSTVLDVTILLLCVSASVVALDVGDGAPDGPAATETADRLVTETATIAYRDADAPNETRRVHATRAEVLALLAVRDADEPFDRRAAAAVRSGIDPRTRIDVEVNATARTEPTTQDTNARTTDGPTPFRTGGTSIPGGPRGGSTTATEERTPIAVGPEPPRDADVDVAVVRQPVPDAGDESVEEPDGAAPVVRIVVRRW